MGSRFGYAYDFRLKMLEPDEITSRYKYKSRDGFKTFIFEFTTNFILKKFDASDIIIDSEKFDTYIHSIGNERAEFCCLSFKLDSRLQEYWMSIEEIDFLLNEILDFARNLPSDPQYVSLNPIPVAVCLEVCTLQQEGEALDTALDRAIRTEHLVPLYMYPSIAMGEFKAMCYNRRSFLRNLARVRVENVEDGLALMPVCSICSRSSKLGDQITSVPGCDHAFHSHCIFRWIEMNNTVCPTCLRPGLNFDL